MPDSRNEGPITGQHSVSDDNPYLVSPASWQNGLVADNIPRKSWPGIGRLAWFAAAVFTGLFAIASFTRWQLHFKIGIDGVYMASMLLLLRPTILRLRNMGYGGGAAALMFVPVINLILVALCLILPPGYAEQVRTGVRIPRTGTETLLVILATIVVIILAFL